MLNPETAQTMTVRELAAALDGQMREFGYAESSLKTYRGICAKIVRYFEERDVERFDVNLGQKFIVEYGGDRYGTNGELKNYCRAVHMLSDLQQYGMVFKQTPGAKKEFSPGFRPLFDEFVQYNRNRGIAEDSIRHLRGVLSRFGDYLLNRGVHVFREVECQHLNAYVETLAGYGRNTVSFHISYLNRLMKYALQQGYHTQDLSAVMPCVKYGQSKRLPAVFTEDEIKRILENVNTDSPVGKRNYAIILLLARLGIRISDILNLQFDSIDWERKRIFVQQQKTGTQLELPLLEDVGWAIIDYLQNARPKTSCPNIFVCHNPPFDRIHSWLAKDISRAVQKAGIRLPRGKTAGTHIFRHSLATNLLNQGVGIDEIAQTLGHTSEESTEAYISLSMDTLRLCALEVDF